MLCFLSIATLSAPAQAAPAPNSETGQASPSVVYDYRGPDLSGEYTVAEILALVRASPSALHEVRGADAREWTPWNHVPTLALAWINGAPSADPSAAHAGTQPAPPPGTPPEPAATPPAPMVRSAPLPEAPRALGASSVARPSVTLGGDVRIDFTAANLERLGSELDGAAAAGFNVSRARPILDVRLGRAFYGRMAIEFRQDDHTTSYTNTGITFDVADWAGGWSVQGREVYLGASFGGSTDGAAAENALRHDVRVGLQEPAFGVRDTYEERYVFAGEGRADLARREGLIPDEDLGVGWHGELGKRWAFDVQLLNGSGGASLDQNNGKDLIARVSAAPIDLLAVSVSGLYGARALDGSGEQAQVELAVEVRGPSQRLLIEGIVGTTTEDRLDTFYSAASASGAWVFPVKGALLESVELVGRFQFVDPVAGFDLPDARWSPAAGGWLNWAVAPAHVVRLGATWEMNVPQDSLLPVAHDVVAEAAWAF
ncbi:MAG: hypothetical protein Q8P18_02470 [Pseudomonadota bacterium]|nr:hypothetical protein [Pseudomonadota bacterium]